VSTGIEVKVRNRDDSYSAWAEQRRNLITNPLGATASASTGYISINSATIAFDAPTKGVRVTAPAAGAVDAGTNFANLVTYTTGIETYTVSMDLIGEVADGWRISVQGTWVPVRVDSAYTPVGVGQTVRISLTFTTNATAKGAIYLLRQTAALASRVVIKNVLFEKGSTALPFFDGASADYELLRNEWTSTPNLSPSIQETRTFSPGSEVLKTDTGYTVREESTPVDTTDTTGAAGSMTIELFNSLSRAATKRLSRKTVTLTDRGQGVTVGVAKVPSGSLVSTSLTMDQRTVALSVVRTAQPFSGTLRNYFIYLLGLVGIVDGYVIDPVYTAMTGTFPGWQDEVWLQMKRLLAAKGGEISLASANIIIRPIRGRVTVDKRDTEFSWSMDDSNLAQAIEGYWYENEQRSAGLAYPPGGWNEDVQVYQVDAGETIEFDLPLNASLSSVNQPTALDYVSREYVGPNSVYCVVGSDGLPVPAAQWVDAGGKIQVLIGEDTRSLIVRITGASIDRYAPFRIAATAGPSDNYSSLRLTGTGVFSTKHGPVRLITSADEDQTSVEIGATVDVDFITSLSDLYDAMAWTLSRYGGPRHSISVQTTGINRSGDSGSYAYPTFEDFNEYATSQGWTTFTSFNTAYAGDLFQDFNETWAATVSESFVNQAFGNVAGARTFRDGLWFRLRTTDISPGGLSYAAENDSTVGDFDTWMLAQLAERGLPNTMASFNTLLAERASFSDMSAAPMSLEN